MAFVSPCQIEEYVSVSVPSLSNGPSRVSRRNSADEAAAAASPSPAADSGPTVRQRRKPLSSPPLDGLPMPQRPARQKSARRPQPPPRRTRYSPDGAPTGYPAPLASAPYQSRHHSHTLPWQS